VRRGDTVLSVADTFGVPAERIRRWNSLRGNTLKPGRRLVIYRPRSIASEETISAHHHSSRSSKRTAHPTKSTKKKKSHH
jgi:peptidoglycan lytic transglycosylase D